MKLGDVIRAALVDISFDPLVVFCAWLLAAIPSIIADLYMEEREGIQFVGIVSLFLIAFQVILTRRSLIRRNLLIVRHDPPRGFVPRAVGQGILWALALLAGVILLVVPAFIVLICWAVCLPALIAEDSSVTESFKRSWTLTKGHYFDIAALFIISSVPALLYIIPLIWLDFAAQLQTPIVLIAGNALFATSQILWWFVQIEIYSQLYKSPSQVS